MNPGPLVLVLSLLMGQAAWAELPGIALYDEGEYAAAAQAFEQALADPQRPPSEKVLARIYLAASLYVLGRMEESQAQLQVLAREHPEVRMDPVRFPPELVALAEGIRERVEADKRFAEQVALNERMKQEDPRNRAVPVHLRAEGLGLLEPREGVWRLGAGLTVSGSLLEGSARAWLGGSPLFHVQGGLTPGHGGLRPFLGLRAVLVPSGGGYGAGAVLGGRLALPAHLLAVAELGADYFLIADEAHHRFAVTAQLGLAFDWRL